MKYRFSLILPLAWSLAFFSACTKKPEAVSAQQTPVQQTATAQSPLKNESTQPIVVKPLEEKLKEKASEAVDRYPANANGKYGFIDKTGKFVIQPKFNAAFGFANGLAPAQNEKALWGYVDASGKWAIQPKYDLALPFSDNIGVFRSNGQYGAVDRSGKVIIPAQFTGMSQFVDGVAAVLMVHQHNGPFTSTAWGFIDREGKYIISPRFENVTIFGEGMAGMRKLGGNWGFIDMKQQHVIAPQFVEVGGFAEGLSSAKDRNMRWGFIDKKGSWVIKPQFINITAFSEGLAGAFDLDTRKWGFIDKTGKYVIAPRFEEATQFNNGLALVLLDGKDTYVDATGKMVWQAPVEKPVEKPATKLTPTDEK